MANAQKHGSAASDGEGFVVAWLDGRESIESAGARPLVLAAARLDAQGVPLSPTATIVREADMALEAPNVVWDGDAFRMAWREGATGVSWGGTLMLGGLDGDGEPVDAVEVADDATLPAFACGPCGCLLVWQAAGLHGAMVRDGVVGPTLDLGSTFGPVEVVPLGGGFLVARTIGLVVVGQLLDAEGTIIDAVELAGGTRARLFALAAAANGSSVEVLVTRIVDDQCWEDPCCEELVDLDVVRVRADGTRLVVDDPVSLDTGVLGPTSAAATFDGTSFMFAWRARWPSSSWCGPPASPDGLRGVRVDPIGAVVEGPEMLPGLVDDEWAVSLASNAAGTTLLSYARFDRERPYEATRVRARVLEPLAAPPGGDPPVCAFPPSAGPDAGIDAGSTPDAGSSPDAGVGGPSGGWSSGGGCSCRVVDGGQQHLGFAWVGLMLVAIIATFGRWTR